VSKALWIPTIWMFLGATRNLSEWFHLSSSSTEGRYLEGNPIDQIAISALLGLGLAVLFTRGRRVRMILQSNIPIVLFFVYCGISILWSDFPDVAFKRWLRASGDVVMILIVLSDTNWLVAVRRLFTRVGFVAMSFSILFIRYFPELGRAYNRGGGTTWTGVATGKNGLGMLCLVFGLASLSRFLQIYTHEFEPRKAGPLIAQGVVFAMSVYLLLAAHSATAFGCFFLAGAPLALTLLIRPARKPAFVRLMVFGILAVTVSALFLNIGTGMVQELGRDSTLTGRTDIWRSAFSQVQNPLFGTGYESFWLGSRLANVQMLIHQTLNQAHNGYIEIYLNVGWVGVILLANIFVSAYRRIMSSIRRMTPMANLSLTYFVAAATYNCTEAAFKMMHPLWIALLLVAMIGPDGPLRESSPPVPLPVSDEKKRPELRPVTIGANPPKPQRVPANVRYKIAAQLWDSIGKRMMEGIRWPKPFAIRCDEPIETF
ncbi:MAG: O-antigen ligase family protein, partial [Candidatus Acidiferrales bacterium]